MSTHCMWMYEKPKSGYAVFEFEDGYVVRLDFDRIQNIETSREYMDITSDGAYSINVGLTGFPIGESVTTIRAAQTNITTMFRDAPESDDDDLPDTPDLDILF